MKVDAFELVRETDLPETRSLGRFFRHRETGMEVFHLFNDERENVFAFAFRTPPADSTGVAHILEHSVLCGSRRYPLKDAFISLAKGSLNTFMNAFTSGDRTVYPAASIVKADYFNLLDAYADAVFFPLLKKEAFLQEGHRLVPLPGGGAEIQGIVYSEMQGNYGSPEGILDDKAFRSLFDRGHPYSYDSGGDPDHIPELTYEDFKAFHARAYHPSNCKLFLYGNIPTEEQLAYLEERALSGFKRAEPVPPLPLQAAFGSPRRTEIAYPAPKEGGKTSVLISWILGETTDAMRTLEAEILSEILLGHDGSPLGRALRESGLGEDLAPQSGIGTETRQVYFQTGLRGIEREAVERTEALIIKTLEGLRDGGIPPKTLDAALKGVEFSYREIKRGSGPYGLRLMRRCMRGWIFGLEPDGTMRVLGVLEEIKARLAKEPRLFEGLIDELLLKNPHRATTVAYPETGLGERRREALAKACGERLAAMGKAERAALDGGLEGLRKFQTEPDSLEALASLPRVRVADLPHEIEVIPTEEHRAGRVPVRYHGIFSNGVSYAEIAVDIGGLPRSLLPWIPLWSRFISSCGLPGLPYHEMSEKLAEAAGGYACILQTGSHCAASDLSRPGVFAVFRLKALDASLPRALGLIKDILLGADSGDAERLQDLYTELRNDLMAAIVPSGSSFAQARGCGALSAAGAIEESWRGVSQYDFLMGLGEKPDPAALKAAMDSIRTGLFPGAAAFISFTADEASREGGLRALGEFANALELGPMAAEPPRRAGELCAPLLPGKDEAYVIPSDVGFASAVMRSPRLGREGYAAHTVLASILSTGPLWNDIRMKRGAYGAWADADPLEGTFGLASYRDPGPAASLADFKKALEWAAGPELDQDEADRGILSVVSGDLRPLTPEEKGLSDMKRILFGVSDELRAGKRREMLGLGAGEIRAAARALLDGWGTKVQTVFAGEAAAREAREALPGIETRTLEL